MCGWRQYGEQIHVVGDWGGGGGSVGEGGADREGDRQTDRQSEREGERERATKGGWGDRDREPDRLREGGERDRDKERERERQTERTKPYTLTTACSRTEASSCRRAWRRTTPSLAWTCG